MEKNNRDYTNGEITVHWKPSECIHSTICYMKLRKVFDPAKRPWVNMDGASSEEIIKIVNKCPTDALTYTRNDRLEEILATTTPTKKEEPATHLQIVKGGPAIINGSFKITDLQGNKIPSGDTISLCRCGHSKNQPFCDGAHNENQFEE